MERVGGSVSSGRQIAGEDVQVSVIIPCLDEACTIGQCIEKAWYGLGSSGIVGEVIVADNGSSDESVDIACAHGARVVVAKTRGYGSAIRAGVGAARGYYVIMGDADDSYDFRNLKPFLDRLAAGDDLVVGNRFQGGICPGAMPWHHRYIGNPLLSGVLNLFFHTNIRDAHCGLRAFRKDSLLRLDLVSTGMELASEMVVKAALRGQKLSEVPTVLYPDKRERRPHLRSFRDGWRHLRLLMMMCPRWFFLIPAFTMLCGGLITMVWLTPGPQRLLSLVLDVHSMLLSCLFVLLGHQTLWFWAFMAMHGWLTGLVRGVHPPIGWLRFLTFERSLAGGALLMCTGILLNVTLCIKWWHLNWGALEVRDTMRSALWGCTLIILGAQLAYGGFLLNALQLTMKRRSVD